MSSEKTTPQLTEAAIKFVLVILQNSNLDDLQINYDAIVQQYGYKNIKVARDTWSRTKKKLLECNLSVDMPSLPSTPAKSPGTKKRKNAAAESSPEKKLKGKSEVRPL